MDAARELLFLALYPVFHCYSVERRVWPVETGRLTQTLVGVPKEQYGNPAVPGHTPDPEFQVRPMNSYGRNWKHQVMGNDKRPYSVKHVVWQVSLTKDSIVIIGAFRCSVNSELGCEC